jgi:hypothetical protein
MNVLKKNLIAAKMCWKKKVSQTLLIYVGGTLQDFIAEDIAEEEQEGEKDEGEYDSEGAQDPDSARLARTASRTSMQSKGIPEYPSSYTAPDSAPDGDGESNRNITIGDKS